MFRLNIQDELVCFRDIKQQHLPQILEWYNKIEDFKYATGIDKPITLHLLLQKYAEVSISSSEFFTGIHTVQNGIMIGILKGRIQNRSKGSAWISSIVIDPAYQNSGYGTASVNLLLEYLKRNYHLKCMYLAVIEENLQGINFWRKNGFAELRRIENHITLNNKYRSAIVMSRTLND